MNHFDDFFKANYRRMVNFLLADGRFNEADIEEEVASAIHGHYDKFRTLTQDDPHSDAKLRRLLTKRAVFDLLSRYTRSTRFVDYRDPHATDEILSDAVEWDTPEDIVSVVQRVPEVHGLLVEYEFNRPYTGDAYAGHMNVQTAHYRLKKSFVNQLNGAGVVRPTVTGARHA